MLTQKEAVIFDLDGSLVDSMWIWPDVDREYMEKYHLTMPERFHDCIEGMSYTETAQYFLDTFPTLHCTLEDVQREWLEMSHERYITQVKLKPGAEEFLEEMHRRGVKLGIATSNTRTLVEDTLEALHVSALFDDIRTSCEVAAGKPAPDVYLSVAESLHVNPEQCLVFEDVPNGIRAGKNAGMAVCAVEDDFSKPLAAVKRELADYYIQNYYDIANKTYEVL
ncbi:HAD family hydrolase [Hespellia stercorisuis]|uniref:Haloacid dehalogenase superfamily, subfamily IA, variant 3 with third motif having DD or ED/haloacid dehalogenase superfamily, subfamily IA, variant 1 with third motif having Dx(3-4)D or Dx(3-4)E n=1 Tax=Hespellia stercorisuis DSM 15480 TaxID=1121950 RepID=A0A1M6S2U6_9FIRM|nr:HAD family phosphatase [Hespellia stercorisuis]SHK39006.1 haloacid dehalogenase superfamily, subfamily IA, variant 3 with third motif having DD or ED/haloacid dehalogenase superfamily, subfamily IA, variant 1 with third motif having Dx(3-4)D or Dx(3-4)E [Hespellia stercorisuis DSM 15480]